MKPLPGDHRHRLLIQGAELKALQSLTGAMAEAFGLDRKIENYKGTRPLTLYRWDLECLMDVSTGKGNLTPLPSYRKWPYGKKTSRREAKYRGRGLRQGWLEEGDGMC